MIDKKKLVESRPEYRNPTCIGQEGYNKGWNDCNTYWHNTIEAQPIVYSVEKVVEQLEAHCFSPIDYGGYAVDTEKAKEIVRERGMNG